MSKPEESRTAQAAEQVEEQGLLDQIVDQGHFSERQRGKDLIREFVTQFLEGSMTASRDTEAMINARIAQIDHLVSIQLNEVLHNAQFQKLEGSWRGLKYLLSQSETGVGLKIKVLNVSKKELLRDLQRAPEFDQSGVAQMAQPIIHRILFQGSRDFIYERFVRKRVLQPFRRA